MNDWYNANEHRCYPFIENRSPSESLPEKEIVDCRFFLKNAKDTTVYLSSREASGDNIIYTFKTDVGDIELTVPKTPDYKVIKFDEDFGYGFVVFGDTTDPEDN